MLLLTGARRSEVQFLCIGRAAGGNEQLVGAHDSSIRRQYELAAAMGNVARLGVFFGMEAEFWLNLQSHFDLEKTREALADRLAEIQPLTEAA